MDSLLVVVLILLVLWALGFWFYPVGSVVHVLLVIVLVIMLVRLLQGRNVL